jgi:hypothetical protein
MTNLPPGVSVRDIPGNRPMDDLWERCAEDVYGWTVEDFEDRLRTGGGREAFRKLFDAVVENEVESLADYLSQRGPEERDN